MATPEVAVANFVELGCRYWAHENRVALPAPVGAWAIVLPNLSKLPKREGVYVTLVDDKLDGYGDTYSFPNPNYTPGSPDPNLVEHVQSSVTAHFHIEWLQPTQGHVLTVEQMENMRSYYAMWCFSELGVKAALERRLYVHDPSLDRQLDDMLNMTNRRRRILTQEFGYYAVAERGVWSLEVVPIDTTMGPGSFDSAEVVVRKYPGNPPINHTTALGIAVTGGGTARVQ